MGYMAETNCILSVSGWAQHEEKTSGVASRSYPAASIPAAA
jgi:hypothetical protein